MSEKYTAYKIAREKALSCAGWKIGSMRERLRYSYYIFDENWRKAERWFEWAAGHKGRVVAALAFLKEQPTFRFMRELERRLHNFCASAKSLVDHTRVVHESLVQYRDVSVEIGELIDSHFSKDGQTQFVLKLRNYLLHYGPISAQYGLEWRGGDLSVPFSFRKNLLLTWDGWNVTARNFIEQASDKLVIRTTLSEYHDHVHKFYDLLYDKHESWFAEEYAEMNRLFADAIDLEKGLDEKKA